MKGSSVDLDIYKRSKYETELINVEKLEAKFNILTRCHHKQVIYNCTKYVQNFKCRSLTQMCFTIILLKSILYLQPLISSTLHVHNYHVHLQTCATNQLCEFDQALFQRGYKTTLWWPRRTLLDYSGQVQQII